MTGAEMIKRAFTALEITGNSALLPERIEIGVATGDQLVWIGLMADIPHHSIPVEVEGLIESESELDNAETGSEVPAAVRDHFQVALTDLSSDILKFCHRQTMQLIGMR